MAPSRRRDVRRAIAIDGDVRLRILSVSEVIY